MTSGSICQGLCGLDVLHWCVCLLGGEGGGGGGLPGGQSLKFPANKYSSLLQCMSRQYIHMLFSYCCCRGSKKWNEQTAMVVDIT